VAIELPVDTDVIERPTLSNQRLSLRRGATELAIRSVLAGCRSRRARAAVAATFLSGVTRGWVGVIQEVDGLRNANGALASSRCRDGRFRLDATVRPGDAQTPALDDEQEPGPSPIRVPLPHGCESEIRACED
jgi:hypothetical protein